jgi:VWFA-related protein
MRLRRYVWMFTLSCLVILLRIQAQDTPFTLDVDVPVVSLDAVVQDLNGRPQFQLTKEDFEIREDGEPRDIRFFGATETPRSTMLLFDVTGVMESQAPFMAKATNVFLANLREQDRIAVATIGPQMDLLMNFRKVEKGKPFDVKLPPTQVGSNIYECLDAAARRLSKEPGRKVIVALTDGRDTLMFNETKRLGEVAQIANDDDFKKRLSTARKRGVPYYIIALDTDPSYLKGYDYEYAYFKNPSGYKISREFANGKRSKNIAEEYLAGVRLRLEQLATATGGRVVYPRSMEDVVDMYKLFAIEMGYSYSLGFSPKAANDGKFHSIEVRVKGDGLKVTQSRNGYGTEASSKSSR